MQMISVDQVYELVEQKLSNKPKLKLTVMPQAVPAVATRR
jgi:hypothetical protein